MKQGQTHSEEAPPRPVDGAPWVPQAPLSPWSAAVADRARVGRGVSDTVANNNVTHESPNRLTRQTAEARLANSLLMTEYDALRNQGHSGAGQADRNGIWEQLAADLHRLLDRIRPRSTPVGKVLPLGGGLVAGQGGRSSDQAAAHHQGEYGQSSFMAPPPTQQAPTERPVHQGEASLEERIRQLDQHQLEAFEDEVLKLINANAKYKKVYDQSPDSMPLVMQHAGNAFERQVTMREETAAAVHYERSGFGPPAPGDADPYAIAAATDPYRTTSSPNRDSELPFAFSYYAPEHYTAGQVGVVPEQGARDAELRNGPPSPASQGGDSSALPVSPLSSPVLHPTVPALPVSPLSSPRPPPANPLSDEGRMALERLSDPVRTASNSSGAQAVSWAPVQKPSVSKVRR